MIWTPDPCKRACSLETNCFPYRRPRPVSDVGAFLPGLRSPFRVQQGDNST
jgi:hypothetical protein